MKRSLLFYILIILFCSCQNKAKNTVSDLKDFLGRTLYIPEQLENQFIKQPYKFKNNLIITIYPKDCTACALENVSMYKLYIDTLKAFNTGISLLSHKDNKEKIEVALKDLKIDFPIIYYDNNEFVTKNNLMKNTLLNTFVINNEKKIIWIGSPIATERTWNLFSKMMKKL